jgi:hypothetical protein
MNTRSAFGTIKGARFTGRYIHSDGYPSYMGWQLANLIRRDGAEEVLRRVTIDRYGWSELDFTRGASPPLGQFRADGRFAIERGYGVAYTTRDGQSAEGKWVRLEVGAPGADGDYGIEWAYAIDTGRRELVVLESGDIVREVARIPLSGLVADRGPWERVEALAAEAEAARS